MSLRIQPPAAETAASSAELLRRLPPATGRLAPEVGERWAAWLERVGAGAPVRRNLDRLRAGAHAIVTGQQAGILGGPLLTLLKAARAVSLAREVEAAGGKPVVPVFWIAGDDHDLDEIHHTFVVNRAGELQKLRIDLGGARGAASTVEVPADAARLVRELFEVAAIAPDQLAQERFLPRSGDSLSTWFARVLLALLGEHGLVPFSPELLGETARPTFERALRDDAGDAIARALELGTEALALRGVEAPLPVESDPPLCLIAPGSRVRLRRRDGRLFAGDAPTSAKELLALPLDGPRRLSANVALRPILQANHLPALAYVAGPTEAKYYEQLAPLHRLFEAPFPWVVPRPAASILSKVAARAMRRLAVDPAELLTRIESRGSRGPAAAASSPWLERGQALRREAQGFVDELKLASPALESAAARRGEQLLQSLDALLERIRVALTEGDAHARQRWTLLENTLRPGGKSQDRVLNALPFFAEHGPALIEALLRLRAEPDQRGAVPHALIYAFFGEGPGPEDPQHG
jgi:bacillithiol synthase